MIFIGFSSKKWLIHAKKQKHENFFKKIAKKHKKPIDI